MIHVARSFMQRNDVNFPVITLNALLFIDKLIATSTDKKLPVIPFPFPDFAVTFLSPFTHARGFLRSVSQNR